MFLRVRASGQRVVLHSSASLSPSIKVCTFPRPNLITKLINVNIAIFCLKNNLSSPRTPIKLRKEWINLLLSKQSFWLAGLLSGLSLLVEAKRRRGELAMYVLPKGLESTWRMARGRGLVFPVGPYGDAIVRIIFAIACLLVSLVLKKCLIISFSFARLGWAW